MSPEMRRNILPLADDHPDWTLRQVAEALGIDEDAIFVALREDYHRLETLAEIVSMR